MGLKNLFRRKPKVVEPTKEEKKEILLTEIIAELRKTGYSDEQIKKKFQEKNYPKEFIDYLLKLNDKQEVKQMAKEKVEEDLEDEKDLEDDEELSDDEDEDSEDSDEEEIEEEFPVKKKKVVPSPKIEKKSKEEPKTEITLETLTTIVQTIIRNQDDLSQRMTNLEATLFRRLGA